MSEFSVPSRRANHYPLLIVLLAILLIVIVGLSAFIYSLVAKRPAASNSTTSSLNDYLQPVTGLLNSGEETDPSDTDAVLTFQPLPTSELRAYPLHSTAGLVLIPLVPNSSPIAVNDAALSGSYSLGLGSSSAQASPDFKSIAFLSDGGQLNLITADGHHKVSLSPKLEVSYLSGWSPDSKLLLAYVTPQTIETSMDMGGMMGDLPSSIEFDRNRLPGGFYLIDVEAGTVKLTTPLTDLVSWKGNSELLVTMGSSVSPNPDYAVFNLATFTLDTATIKDTFKPYFAPQIDMNADGTRWAITLHKATEGAEIILADYPSLTGQQVAIGAFAAVQNPIISPNGQQVLYQAYDVVNGPNYVHLWKDGTATRIGKGIPLTWVDDTSYLMAEMNPEYSSNPDNHLSKLQMVDSNTGVVTTLYTK